MQRIWTMNNHFASYHIYELIKRYGPLRYYSCRSLERTIQKYTNLAKSKSASGKESSNLVERYQYFKTYTSQLNQEGLVAPRRVKETEYEDHPDDIEGIMPQLWERFEIKYLSQEGFVAKVPISDIELALKKYFGRLPNGISRLDNDQVKLAARVRIDDKVIQSRWHRENQKNVRRANDLVIIQAKESAR